MGSLWSTYDHDDDVRARLGVFYVEGEQARGTFYPVYRLAYAPQSGAQGGGTGSVKVVGTCLEHDICSTGAHRKQARAHEQCSKKRFTSTSSGPSGIVV